MQLAWQQKLSRAAILWKYRAIDMWLHITNQIWAQPMLPTVYTHQNNTIKHNDQAQINSLYAFIYLFG
jgi:hypothetical protein